MDIKKQVEIFKNLPYEDQRAKVTEMLKQLQWTHETFVMFYKTISTLSRISEAVLLYLYQSILEIAAEIDAGRKDNAQEKIKKMAEVIMAIKKEEEMEREREGDPDNMLKNM